MVDKVVILRRHHRSFHIDGNLLVGHPLMPQLGLRILLAQFGETDRHEARFPRIGPFPPQHPPQHPQMPGHNNQQQHPEDAPQPDRQRFHVFVFITIPAIHGVGKPL